MDQLPTSLEGPLLLAPPVFRDDRGFFCETFREEAFSALGIHEQFIQDNHSRSRRGTIRGMHFQIGDGTSKLIRCGRGSILDVLVDIRRGSPTYGEWEAFELSDENMHVIYAPVGFAHGFCVLSDVADVIYKQSNYYSDAIERGFRYDDPEVGIAWPFAPDDRVISQRDATAPALATIAYELPFSYG